MKNLLILSAAFALSLASCSKESDSTPSVMDVYFDQISGEYSGIRIHVNKEVFPLTRDTIPLILTVSSTNVDSVIEVSSTHFSGQFKYNDNAFHSTTLENPPGLEISGDSLQIDIRPGLANIYSLIQAVKTPVQ